MSNNEQARLHAFLQGRVQGVGFRAFVVEKAFALGVKGWTRNRWDGSVEVVAEGEQTTLESLMSALHRGPRMSIVTKVDVNWETPTGEFSSFYVRSTA
jgi:acylphosphatase